MAIAAGAAVVTWVVKGLPTWVRVVCVLAAVIAIVNVITVEAELDERRQEIDNLLD